MAITLENLIDLDLLTYYDENLKKYIVTKIDKTLNNTQFTTRNNLPVEGKEDVIYIVEDSILYWNGDRFVTIGNNPTSVEATTWGKF